MRGDQLGIRPIVSRDPSHASAIPRRESPWSCGCNPMKLDLLDAWMVAQDDIRETRQDAIRRLIAMVCENGKPRSASPLALLRGCALASLGGNCAASGALLEGSGVRRGQNASRGRATSAHASFGCVRSTNRGAVLRGGAAPALTAPQSHIGQFSARVLLSPG
jgi:hypothetical protein